MKSHLYIAILALFFAACSADTTEYAKGFQCYFSFDKTYHPVSPILDCVAQGTSGLFCSVRKNEANGIRTLTVQLNDGKPSQTITISNELELRRSCILGAQNGLIIGRSALNEGEIYAYDLHCPNCLEAYRYTPLQWTSNGMSVSCHSCNRTYNLLNGGFIDSGDPGTKLLRYHASYNGTILLVTN